MRQTRIIMGMPIIVEIVDKGVKEDVFKKLFDYLRAVDKRFSTYKKDSEISKINRGEINHDEYSPEMREIFALSEKTKKETGGYFEIFNGEQFDPSGMVKGWAIEGAVRIIRNFGFKNFYVNAGGDVQTSGNNAEGKKWKVGIRNPFKQNEIIKIVSGENVAVATSGNYIRGDHIYDPRNFGRRIGGIVSLTVVAGNIFDADRFATAAFAMGEKGIYFLEKTEGLEGYQIDEKGRAIFTSGFEKYNYVSS